MDPLECYTFEEAIDKETGFTRSQPQEYLKLLDNIKILSDLIPHSNPESKRVARQTDQITETIQGKKDSLKFVILRCTEGSKLRGRKEYFSRFHEVPRGRF